MELKDLKVGDFVAEFFSHGDLSRITRVTRLTKTLIVTNPTKEYEYKWDNVSGRLKGNANPWNFSNIKPATKEHYNIVFKIKLGNELKELIEDFLERLPEKSNESITYLINAFKNEDSLEDLEG